MPKTLPLILLLICAYFVCWASIPIAANPADRLQMRGEPVNLSNMCDEFLTSTNELFSQQSSFDKDGKFAAGLIYIMKWLCYAFGILLVISCIGVFITIVLSVVGAFSYPWSAARNFLGEDFPILVVLDSSPNWLIWTAIISLLSFIGLTLYLTVHFIFKILGRVRPLSTSLRVTCMIFWMLSIVVCTASSTKIGGNAAHYYYYMSHKKDTKQNNETKKDKEKKQLIEAGWEIIKDNNIRNYINKGEHYSGDRNLTYLDAGMLHDGLNMEYEVEKTQKVIPGTYRLEAKGRANGIGAEIYVVAGDRKRLFQPIPVCGNKGGGIWKNAAIALDADTAKILPNRHYLNKLTKVNNLQGYGWTDIVIDNIVVGQDSIIKFGLTNVSPTHTWDGTWLSATSFELIKKD